MAKIEKIARICWNENGWQSPSGSNGKSKNKTFESANGYGHEEWLLSRKQICSDGYHYGYLQPLSKSPFKGKINIHLYTYTPNSQKQYIGCIVDAEYVDEEKQEDIWEEYKKNGWLKSMRMELKDIGINKNWYPDLNVRFKFEKLIDKSNEAVFLHKDDPNTQCQRYVLLNKKEDFKFDNIFPDIISDSSGLPEGAKLQVTVNKYERNSKARMECIAKHGYKCKVCGIDFYKTYGEIGKEFIHVHHIVPLSDIGKNYNVDPIKDLIPVCPNCHAMLHRSINGNTLSVGELKSIMKKQQ